jgi:phage terminase small subunit
MGKGKKPDQAAPIAPVEKVVPIRPGVGPGSTNAVEPKPSVKPRGSSVGPRKPQGGPRKGPTPLAEVGAKLLAKASKGGAKRAKKPAPRRPENALTPKQEAFCLAYVGGMNASDSYRKCYDASRMTSKSVNEKACELLASVKVASRVEALREAMATRALVTMESLTKEIEEAYEIAKETRCASVMIQASIAKAKLHGMVTEKVETRTNFVVEAPAQDETTEDWLKAVSPRAG